MIRKNPVGTHILLDHHGGSRLTDASYLESALKSAAHAAGATILSSSFHTFGGHGGITGVLLLAESHISIHTWPEKSYAAIDIFMCGGTCPERAVDCLAELLHPVSVDITRIHRGALTEPEIPPVQIVADQSM
ncbi:MULTISPECIES: adenosylmethionine decarboxylase [unclassified Ruegeria]|uniref:adenosylmethionine decarboxylase n=1 Tax=unclassified Ruegeria TaxID=2625375 RepID=UPI001ADA5A4C|nr:MULTISPECIES: adenosylmethionine decarboxylase [unclassified Ruegeria]MBO9413621.1 adenosylmethionine decarboxylase [Ruegeria sp. R8_1]MBO9417607.1 adenosylmethionine decarboxylase [Ruegeria sp. R8_2]